MAGIEAKYYYLTLGLLALCTIIGLIVVYSFQRDINNELTPPTAKDLFDPLEKAYYSGLMDEVEFHRIQESIARQKGEVYRPSTKKLRARPNLLESPPPAPLTDPEVGHEPDTEPGSDKE